MERPADNICPSSDNQFIRRIADACDYGLSPLTVAFIILVSYCETLWLKTPIFLLLAISAEVEDFEV